MLRYLYILCILIALASISCQESLASKANGQSKLNTVEVEGIESPVNQDLNQPISNANENGIIETERSQPRVIESQESDQIERPSKEKPSQESEFLPKPKTTKIARISFESTIYNFGEIEEGDQIERSFKFTNTGNAPLNIMDVSASCGCTVPSYPIMPIEPGGKGEIGVLFNSKGKFGAQKPFMTIKSNASDPIVKLYLSGSIKHVFEKSVTDTISENK